MVLSPWPSHYFYRIYSSDKIYNIDSSINKVPVMKLNLMPVFSFVKSIHCVLKFHYPPPHFNSSTVSHHFWINVGHNTREGFTLSIVLQWQNRFKWSRCRFGSHFIAGRKDLPPGGLNGAVFAPFINILPVCMQIRQPGRILIDLFARLIVSRPL